MDTNQTNAGQVGVGETIDAAQAAEVGGGCDTVTLAQEAINIYENMISATVYVAERVTEALK